MVQGKQNSHQYLHFEQVIPLKLFELVAAVQFIQSVTIRRIKRAAHNSVRKTNIILNS